MVDFDEGLSILPSRPDLIRYPDVADESGLRISADWLFLLLLLYCPIMAGQLCLKKASVLLVGAGGLGCPAAAYIAGAGIGTIGLVDGDVVEASNLHRQIAHTTSRVGEMKVDSAISYLKEQAFRPSHVVVMVITSHTALEDTRSLSLQSQNPFS